MGATRTGLTGVLGWNSNDKAAIPCCLVFQLPAKFRPALIENRPIQAGLLFHLLAVLFAVALGRLGHIPNLQIFDGDHGVVLADLARSFMQEVFPGVGDARMNLLDLGFSLLPVVAELHLATHGSLIAGEAHQVFLEAVERLKVAAVAQRGETDDAHINADGFALRQRLIDFARRLDRHKPLAAGLAHRDILNTLSSRRRQLKGREGVLRTPR